MCSAFYQLYVNRKRRVYKKYYSQALTFECNEYTCLGVQRKSKKNMAHSGHVHYSQGSLCP
jgi:hypothetical protein